MKRVFDKKIFTAGLFLGDVGFLLWNIFRIADLFRRRKITRIFFEKIMTVTTAVNGCVYCTWFHARQAVNAGITKAELKNLMDLQFHTDAGEYELTALLYAQHFAETNRKPDSIVSKDLFDFYGEKIAKQIILVIRMINFGNLYGNTWDAVISRFKGRPAANSNIVFEILFFLVNAIIMVPVMIVMRID
jgi:AhpD family alkylhydroperoxidase